MSMEDSNNERVTTRPTVRTFTIITPHVLRFRRPVLRQRATLPQLCAASEGSRSPSPQEPRRTASVCWSAASSSSAETVPSVSVDSDGGDTASASVCLATADAQASWCAATLSSPCHCQPGTNADAAHLPMGCDLTEAASAILQLRQRSAPLDALQSPQQGGTASTEAMLPVQHASPPAPSPRDLLAPCGVSVTPELLSPLLGCKVLSAADIPLQDEHVIDSGQDGATLSDELFSCTEEPASAGGSRHRAAAGVTEDCGEEAGKWKSASPQLIGPDPILCPDGSSDGSQLAAPGCRCSLAESYNKRLMLDHVNVQILPAGPLSPAEDRGVPESKASVAIQRLINSVVPPIGADLVPPQLYLDTDSVSSWSAPMERAAAARQQPQLAGCDADDPPPAAAVAPLHSPSVEAALFLPSVGPPADLPDSLLMPDGPAVLLTGDDVVEIEEVEVSASAPTRRARGGRVRGRRASGSTRRGKITAAVGDGERASRGRRGRGRRSRGRARGRGASSARGRATVMSGRGRPDPSQVSAPGGDLGDERAERPPPGQHFRKVVVGLSDLGPEPLAPTSKNQLWRQLSGMPEMADLCQCLDLSYLAVRAPDGSVSYRCNICRKDFALHSSVRRHHRMVHDDERRYTCAECAASYYQLSDLKRHLLASHTNLKPFECCRCGEQFSRACEFRKHVSNHWI